MASCKDDTHKCTNGTLAQDKRKVCRLSGSQLVRVFCHGSGALHGWTLGFTDVGADDGTSHGK